MPRKRPRVNDPVRAHYAQALRRRMLTAPEAVQRVLLSNRVNYWTGEECRQFEKEFAAWCGTPHAVALANGTLALDVALKALNVGPGDEVVVSRLDHDADVRPWVIHAERAGATVRWADFDPATGELTPDDVVRHVTPRTRLVALTGASNLIGTRPDLAAIGVGVHEHGALLYVDGVHLTAHAPIDVAAIGCDFYACSPYKFLGPHCGVLAADPALIFDTPVGQRYEKAMGLLGLAPWMLSPDAGHA